MSDHWIWTNFADTPGAVYTIQTGDFAGELDIAQLRDPRVGKHFRAETMPSQIRIQLVAARRIGMIGLFDVNLPNLSKITIRIGTTSGGNDIGVVAVDGGGSDTQFVHLWLDAAGVPAPLALASHVTIIAEGATPFELGRVWIGGAPDWTPRVGHTYGPSNWQVVDLSVRTPTPREGAFLIDIAAKQRIFTAQYDALYPEEYNGILFDFDRLRGLSQQLVFVPDPGTYPLPKWPILGYLRELPETSFIGYLRAVRPMTIVEAG